MQLVNGKYAYVTSLNLVWDTNNNWHAANATSLAADGIVVFQLCLNGELIATSSSIVTM